MMNIIQIKTAESEVLSSFRTGNGMSMTLTDCTGIIPSDAEQTTFTFKNTSNQCMLMLALHAFCTEAFYQAL